MTDNRIMTPHCNTGHITGHHKGALTCHPLALEASRNFIMFLVLCTGRASRAPDEALLTAGLSGAEFF
jgi:hypothetical protein